MVSRQLHFYWFAFYDFSFVTTNCNVSSLHSYSRSFLGRNIACLGQIFDIYWTLNALQYASITITYVLTISRVVSCFLKFLLLSLLLLVAQGPSPAFSTICSSFSYWVAPNLDINDTLPMCIKLIADLHSSLYWC